MAVDRLLPTDEARDLIALTRDVADKALAPSRTPTKRPRHTPTACSRHSARRDC